MQKYLIKSDYDCCKSKSLSSESRQLELWSSDDATDCLRKSTIGTISSTEVARCLGRLLSRRKSTWWRGRFSEKTLVFTEFFVRSNFQSERVPGKDGKLWLELKLRARFSILTITDSMNNWCELMRWNNITNLLNPFQALTTEPLCCYLEFFTNQSIS